MKDRIKVLWLASWYPNKIAAFNGDFIKRHAEAVSLYADIHVLHIAKDEKGTITRDIESEEFESPGLKETIVYYYSAATGIRLIDKLFSEIKFRKIIKEFAQKIIAAKRPDLVHVHVGLKAGIISGWVKKKFNIPYLVTEHWTGLLEESTDNFSLLLSIRQSAWRNLWSNANAVTAVSHHLAAALKKRFAVHAVVIPNVVDTKFFYPVPAQRESNPHFIFISTFDEFKNPEQVLKAFADFVKEFPAAKLTVFAPQEETVIEKCRQLGIENSVYCSGEIPQAALAKSVSQSDALLLYSSYETFGCVIIEANAAGVPVIVSDIPAMRELVKDGVNGLLVKAGDAGELTAAMRKYMAVQHEFDKSGIAGNTAAKFSYAVVGKQFGELYESIIDKS